MNAVRFLKRSMLLPVALLATLASLPPGPGGLAAAADQQGYQSSGKESPGGNGASGAGGMSQEDMKKMMALATPGEQHKIFDHLVGTWKLTIKMWMGPGEPTVNQGTAKFEWILGGRYLKSTQIGNFNDMPFEGMELDGYDNAQKQYFAVWLDNMGTGVMNLTGQPTADGKGINYSGETFEPMQNKNVKVREEVRYTSNTSYTFTMYMQMPGPGGATQETKVMEITGQKS
jgi:hypothetical protein